MKNKNSSKKVFNSIPRSFKLAIGLSCAAVGLTLVPTMMTSCSSPELNLNTVQANLISPNFVFYASNPNDPSSTDINNIDTDYNLIQQINKDFKEQLNVDITFDDYSLNNLGIPHQDYSSGLQIEISMTAKPTSKVLKHGSVLEFMGTATSSNVQPFDISTVLGDFNNEHADDAAHRFFIPYFCNVNNPDNSLTRKQVIDYITNFPTLLNDISNLISADAGKHDVKTSDFYLVVNTELPATASYTNPTTINVTCLATTNNPRGLIGSFSFNVSFKSETDHRFHLNTIPIPESEMVYNTKTPSCLTQVDVDAIYQLIVQEVSRALIQNTPNRHDYPNDYTIYFNNINSLLQANIMNGFRADISVRANENSEELVGEYDFNQVIRGYYDQFDLSDIDDMAGEIYSNTTTSISCGDVTKVPVKIIKSIDNMQGLKAKVLENIQKDDDGNPRAPEATIDEFSLSTPYSQMKDSDLIDLNTIGTVDGEGVWTVPITLTVTAKDAPGLPIKGSCDTSSPMHVKFKDLRVTALPHGDGANYDYTVDKSATNDITLKVKEIPDALSQVSRTEATTDVKESSDIIDLVKSTIAVQASNVSTADYSIDSVVFPPLAGDTPDALNFSGGSRIVELNIKATDGSLVLKDPTDRTGGYQYCTIKVKVHCETTTDDNKFITVKSHSYFDLNSHGTRDGGYEYKNNGQQYGANTTWQVDILGWDITLNYNTSKVQTLTYDSDNVSGLSLFEIATQKGFLRDSIASVPHVAGFNNHISAKSSVVLTHTAYGNFPDIPITTSSVGVNIHWDSQTGNWHDRTVYMRSVWESLYLKKIDDFHFCPVWKGSPRLEFQGLDDWGMNWWQIPSDGFSAPEFTQH